MHNDTLLADLWGSGGIAPRILNFGTSLKVNGKHHVPAVLFPEKELPVRFLWMRKCLASTGIEPQHLSVLYCVTYTVDSIC